MKTWITAAALVISLAGAADAATRTFQAVFTAISNNGALELLAADRTATEMVFTWTFDEAAVPYSGPSLISASRFTLETARRPFSTFGAEVGGISLVAAPSISSTDSISITDGIANGSFSVSDSFSILSDRDTIGPNGTMLRSLQLSASSADLTSFSGTDHPDAAELNSLNFLQSARIVVSRNGLVGTIESRSGTFSDITPVVPLPAGLPLLAGGLLTLGLLRRCIARR